MNDTVLMVIITVQTVLLFILLWRMFQRKDDSSTGLLKQDIDNLSKTVDGLKDGLTDKLSENQKMMYEGLAKQFKESTKLITDVTRNLSELKETNKQVVGVTDELKTLQNILSNPKQRGVLGEYYLETVLENVLPKERFQMQYKFKDGEVVDAVIKLDKNRILPIDSKFSLENYNRLVEEKDKKAKETLVKTFKTDLKLRIDETSKYIRPDEGTLDYAFMFIPSEAIYYDLLANRIGEASTSSRDLLEYAFVDKKVIIVSPTTFAAYLQTVMQGLRSLQIEEQAKEIQKRVGQLGRHIESYEDFMQRLGKSLSTTVNHYNAAHKELKKVDKDVVKIADSAPSVEPLLVDRPSQEE
ncbi:MAG: DNA recombination protein RmuC [Candidatus Saccharimonadales bacterium]|nr:DNA recombination protein RmuC [Candidatus Saccharimonadales bacterium]